MKKLIVMFALFLVSCMTPTRIVERYETDSVTGKTIKYVTKYYDSVRYVREPAPYYPVYPYYNPFFYRPFWGPRVIIRQAPPRPQPPVYRQRR